MLVNPTRSIDILARSPRRLCIENLKSKFVLATALFHQGISLEPETLTISFAMTLMYTWFTVRFSAYSGAWHPGFSLWPSKTSTSASILLFFVVFEFGFVAAAFIFAEPVLHALAWSAILIGNLLAAGAMAVYLWSRHPNLTIRP